ncbi:DEAD/DEAH box helicase [Lentibacillus jeotgali]|uniref:DEAD/DEAH box helicase n=1 Tax=Lentibacillus jeotgali TaxID=558169 RepID=UPI001FE0BCB7|nr:helicase-related protein [Lentibacillus jeotgali]
MTCSALYEWSGPEYFGPHHKNPCTWTGELTRAQQKAADRIVQAILNREQELLTWAVCGAGKTEMLFPGIAQALEMGQRVCIATPRSDVVRELLPRLRTAFSGICVQGLYGGSLEKDGTAQLIIATTHQLLRFKHAFDVIIIDEVDAFPYTHDPSLPFAADRAKKERCTTLYLTATPRRDQQLQMTRKKLPHVFVPVRFHGYPLPVPVFHMCYSLKKDLQKSSPPKAFFKWFANRKNQSRQLLIFVPTIKLSESLTRKLSVDLPDFKFMAVHASDHDREEKVLAFREKQFQILVTTTILERGVTFPSVDVVILDAGHTVFDEAALVQIAGRAGRSPDDPTGEVVFFHDGKTEAMIEAVRAITKMNKRGGFH